MEEWTRFINHSIDRRLPADKFEQFANILNIKNPLPSHVLAEVLLRPGTYNHYTLDPQVLLYVPPLLQSDLLDVPSILRALLKYSTLRSVEASKGQEADISPSRWGKSYPHEESLIYGLSKLVGAGTRPKSRNEAFGILTTITKWMKLLALAGAADDMLHQMGMGAGSDLQVQEAMMVRVAVGTLLVAVAENEMIVANLKKLCPPDLIKVFSQTLASFIPLLLHASTILAERLELFRTHTLLPLEPVDKKTQRANDEIDEILDSTMALNMDNIPIVDVPIMNSRAGLYVYLNSLLVGRPMVDDNSLLNFLHNRYQNDIQNTCIELILSSFDILANATFRNENIQTTTILRSFLINKVPLLLSVLSTSIFPPLSSEPCITEALSHVDTNAFPTFSSMFDETSSGNIFSDSVRQDFCFACCLHGLIAEESIERLLGEIPMQTLPAGGRYIKEDLVQQCLSDPERIEAFVDELEHMDGNVGAVSQAITEVIRHLCENKDTMSLKTLCSHLARKPSSLDVLLLFDKPNTILQPICHLLDGWRYEEDQGEYQPVYEEFGSILLLVLAFVYRYDLSTFDLGIQGHDSFIAKLLVRGSISRSMDELSELEKKQLDGWIRGLYNAEGGGLGDEPMSNCPPQDFYLLVPTFFSNAVLAYHSGYISDDILKGGLEYLVDTFLLPSLVGAIKWLANHLWESHGDSNAVVHILEIIVSPNSISNEASMMLSSILNIVAAPLEHALRSLQRAEPTRQDVEPLSKVLKPHLSFHRTASSDHTEMESWSNAHNGPLTNTIRRTIQQLVHWSLTPGINVMPTSYTHRQILLGVRMLGAKRLLLAIVDEIRHMAMDHVAVIYDVAAAIVCAPTAGAEAMMAMAHNTGLLDEAASAPQPLQHRLTLREALKFEAETAAKRHKEPAERERAEMIIRLYRRVEAMMAGTGEMSGQAGLLHDGLGGLDAGLQGGAGHGLGGHELGAIAGLEGGDMMHALGDGMMGLEEGMLDDMKLDF